MCLQLIPELLALACMHQFIPHGVTWSVTLYMGTHNILSQKHRIVHSNNVPHASHTFQHINVAVLPRLRIPRPGARTWICFSASLWPVTKIYIVCCSLCTGRALEYHKHMLYICIFAYHVHGLHVTLQALPNESHIDKRCTWQTPQKKKKWANEPSSRSHADAAVSQNLLIVTSAAAR